MTQRDGLGAVVDLTAREVADRYEIAMEDGEISPREDAWIRAGHDENCDEASRAKSVLRLIATAAHCGPDTRRVRELVREWRLTHGPIEAEAA